MAFVFSFARSTLREDFEPPEPPDPPIDPPPEPGSVEQAIADIADWWTLGLPIFGLWCVGGGPTVATIERGFNPTWQHARISTYANRIRPTIFLPIYNVAATNCINPGTINSYVNNHANAIAFFNTNEFPLCLRTNNICNALTGDHHRLPLELASIPDSPLSWWYDPADGLLDDRPIVDMFGPVASWTTEGQLWGSSPLVQRVAELFPNPAVVVFVENNEATEDGVMKCSDLAPPPLYNEYGDRNRTWKSYSALTGEGTAGHLRWRDHINDVLGFGSDPNDFWPTYWTARQNQYFALYDAFNAEIPASWGIPVTVGYGADGFTRIFQYEDEWGPHPGGLRYDCATESAYNGSGIENNFIHRHQWNKITESTEGQVYRESVKDHQIHFDLSISIDDEAFVWGKDRSLHEVITLDLYYCYIRWELWMMQKPGRPVCMSHYESFSTNPASLKCSSGVQTKLINYGHPEMATTTFLDVAVKVMAAIDQICTNATLRDFWLNATEPEGWFEPEEEPLTTLTWPAVRVHPDGRALVCVWSPMATPPNVTVTLPVAGPVSIPVPAFGGGYYIVDEDGTITALDVGDE